jgi:hypothetical protein
MKGSVSVYVDIGDPCIDIGPMHFCPFEIFGKNRRLEIPIWKGAGWQYDHDLFNRTVGPIYLSGAANPHAAMAATARPLPWVGRPTDGF